MAKRVIGSYPTEATALEKINQLLTDGYSKESITLVTNPDTEKSIHSQTDVPVIVSSSESKDDESLGDRIRAFFSLNTQEDAKLNSAIPNEKVLADHKKSIEKGSIVILVEEKLLSNGAEDTYLTDVPPLEDDPSNLASNEKQTHSIRTQHLDFDDVYLDTDITTDGDLEIEENFPPTESPDRTDFY